MSVPIAPWLGVLSPDNLVAGGNSESAWWPLSSPPPNGIAFTVCLRAYITGTFNATLRIYQGSVFAVNSWTVFTTPALPLSQFGEYQGLPVERHLHVCVPADAHTHTHEL